MPTLSNVPSPIKNLGIDAAVNNPVAIKASLTSVLNRGSLAAFRIISCPAGDSTNLSTAAEAV